MSGRTADDDTWRERTITSGSVFDAPLNLLEAPSVLSRSGRSAHRNPTAGIAFGLALLGSWLLLGPSTAHAQLTGDQAVAMAQASRSNLPPDSFGGQLGFGGIGKDFFLTLALRINFDRDMWGVGFQLPLRLRLIDNDPQDDNDFGGILRREDWDEPSDFLRVLRYVYVGQRDKKGPFYVRIGELSGLTVGHGTIMNRYFNGIDVNRWHTGINAAVNIHAFGLEAVVGDVADPYVAGLRATVRPLMFGSSSHTSTTMAGRDGENGNTDGGADEQDEQDEQENSWRKKLVVGASLMTDSKAPLALGFSPADANNPDVGEVVRVDDKDVPIVARERTLAIFGIDVGYELVDTSILDITPYVDLNKMNVVDSGWGLHLGVLWNLSFPLVIDTLTVDLRTEYRRVSHDYLGPYFNTVYEIERYQALSFDGGRPTPKLGVLCGSDLEDCSTSGGPGKNGLYFDLLAGLPNFIFIGGEYLDYDGGEADGELRLSLEVPALQVVKFSAFYYRVNIRGLSDAFKLDDRSAIVAAAEIPLYTFLSLQARWWRVWQPGPDGQGYTSVDDWSVGAGFNLTF